MDDRSGLALVVGLTYQLVQWWHLHEAPFDDCIYAMFITVKTAVFLDLQYWHTACPILQINTSTTCTTNTAD